MRMHIISMNSDIIIPHTRTHHRSLCFANVHCTLYSCGAYLLWLNFGRKINAHAIHSKSTTEIRINAIKMWMRFMCIFMLDSSTYTFLQLLSLTWHVSEWIFIKFMMNFMHECNYFLSETMSQSASHSTCPDVWMCDLDLWYLGTMQYRTCHAINEHFLSSCRPQSVSLVRNSISINNSS